MATKWTTSLALLFILFGVVSANTQECVRTDKLIDCWNFCTPRDTFVQLVYFKDLREIPTCMNKCFQTTVDHTPITPHNYQFQLPKKSTSFTEMIVPTVFAIFLVVLAISCPKLFV